MKTRRQFLTAVVLMLGSCVISLTTSFAQKPASRSKNPQSNLAFFQVINTLSTDLPDRWKAAISVKAGEEFPARDLRIGEKSRVFALPSGKNAKLDIYSSAESGEEKLITSIDLSSEPGVYTAVFLTGTFSKSKKPMQASLITKNLFPPGDLPPRPEEISIYNFVTSYEVAIKLPEKPASLLKPEVPLVLPVKSGTVDFQLICAPDGKQPIVVASGFQCAPGQDLVVGIYPSAERNDRPTLLILNPRQMVNDLLETLKQPASTAPENSPLQPPSETEAVPSGQAD